MVNYISLEDMSADLGIYEYEIRLGSLSNADGYEVGETLTGGTSGETMVVNRIVSTTKIFCASVSGKMTLSEELTGGNNSYTSNLLFSDAYSLQSFIERVQNIIEKRTKKKLLQTGESYSHAVTTNKITSNYTTPSTKLPIISITSVTINDSLYDGVEGTDYYVNKGTGVWNFPSLFKFSGTIGGYTYTGRASTTKSMKRRGNMVLVFTWGDASITYETLDPSIKQIVSHGVRKIYDRWFAENIAPAMSSINPAQFGLTFNFEELFDDTMKEMLQYETRWLLR